MDKITEERCEAKITLYIFIKYNEDGSPDERPIYRQCVHLSGAGHPPYHTAKFPDGLYYNFPLGGL